MRFLAWALAAVTAKAHAGLMFVLVFVKNQNKCKHALAAVAGKANAGLMFVLVFVKNQNKRKLALAAIAAKAYLRIQTEKHGNI